MIWIVAALADPTVEIVHNDQQVQVLVGDAALTPLRQRDFVSAELVGLDRLWVVTQDGGPGTCIWSQTGTLYAVGDSLEALRSVSLGDYLPCAQGPRSCGCGTWEASWTVDGEELRIKPHTTYVVAGAGAPPPESTLAIP